MLVKVPQCFSLGMTKTYKLERVADIKKAYRKKVLGFML